MNRFLVAKAIGAGLTAGALLFFSPSIAADELREAARLNSEGQGVQALERVEKYLSAHPKDAKGRFLKGVILAEQGNRSEAIKVFTELTRDYPELPEPYNNLAVLYASLGQYDKARVALELAIRTHPSYATAYENLGDIYAKMASQAYDKALQIDKGNTSAQSKLSLVKELFPAGKGNRAPVMVAQKKDQAIVASAPGAGAVPPTKTAPTAPVPAASKPEPRTEPAPLVKPETKPEVAQKPQAVAKTPAAGEPKEKADAKVKEAASMPAEKTAVAKADSAAAERKAAVLKAVNAWADAWADQNVEKYLAAYAKSFDPPGNEKRSDWEKTRKDRVSSPKYIKVSVNSPKVELTDDNNATVTFRQSYRSDTFKGDTRKTLKMIYVDNAWRIKEEIAGR